MMAILYDNKVWWIPEAAGMSLDILFDIHFMYISKNREYDIYKDVKKDYKETVPLMIKIATAEITRNIKKRVVPKTQSFTVVSSKYIEIVYHNKKQLKIEDDVLYTHFGYIEFIGYGRNKNEAFRAYLFNEGQLLKLLYTMYNPPKEDKTMQEQKGIQ